MRHGLATLKNEISRLEAELARYAEAIANVGPLATILQAVKVREQRRDAIRTELKTLATPRSAEARDTSQVRPSWWNTLSTGVPWHVRVSRRRAASCARFSSAASSSRPRRHRQSCRRGKVPAESRASCTS